MGFPKGPVYLAQTQAERLGIVKQLRDRFEFAAGIGDRWDDNELHLELGCLSIILKEHEGNWDTVPAVLAGEGPRLVLSAISWGHILAMMREGMHL